MKISNTGNFTNKLTASKSCERPSNPHQMLTSPHLASTIKKVIQVEILPKQEPEVKKSLKGRVAKRSAAPSVLSQKKSKKTQFETKKVAFHPMKQFFPIPNRHEYHEEGLASELWRTEDEEFISKMDFLSEIEDYARLHSIDARSARRKLCQSDPSETS